MPVIIYFGEHCAIISVLKSCVQKGPITSDHRRDIKYHITSHHSQEYLLHVCCQSHTIHIVLQTHTIMSRLSGFVQSGVKEIKERKIVAGMCFFQVLLQNSQFVHR